MKDAFELDNELTTEQKDDLRIMLSLRGKEQIQEWMDAVGYEDVMYGISLMEIAAIKELEREITDSEHMVDAKIALSRIMTI